jgi:hypothetical protein
MTRKKERRVGKLVYVTVSDDSDDRARDVVFAYELLVGRAMVDENGTARSMRYVEPGTEEERERRAALARMLRGQEPLNRFVRNHLADLLDPDCAHAQELVLKSRIAGHSQDNLRDVHVARYLADAVAAGASLQSAIEAAASLFGISEPTTKRIWARFGKAFRNMDKELAKDQIDG